MTTTTDHNLEELAARLGATIVTHDGGEKGRYYGHGIISLRRGLGPKNYRCTLAHELAHHALGHDPAATGWVHDRQERQAEKWAAQHLISPTEYAAAETLYGPQPSQIAHELGVTVKVLKTWASIYERNAPHEYRSGYSRSICKSQRAETHN
ncbi:ImmA/IrrE family metallo-endopeptidase [Corynebacterium striatum]|uniref:ImmA/IrrE family metallo-endopeptidase n=1 Tax=Corynebacterium striatum TaxID=43770 RepID=UPI003F8082F6